MGDVTQADKGILIVEDDDSMRKMLSTMLKKNGYELIFEANDGVEALSVMARAGEQIYVVLLDVVMPRKDGIEVFKYISNAHQHVVGVLFITGFAAVLEKAKDQINGAGSSVAATQILSKPFKLGELMNEVNSLLLLVDQKRIRYGMIAVSELKSDIVQIQKDIIGLKSGVEHLISHRRPNFLASIGADVLRGAIIALFLLGALVLSGGGDWGVLARLVEAL